MNDNLREDYHDWPPESRSPKALAIALVISVLLLIALSLYLYYQ